MMIFYKRYLNHRSQKLIKKHFHPFCDADNALYAMETMPMAARQQAGSARQAA
tara:strand:+ start:11622 stop:11780 length:159 start_codon:yes stop_codon:yes gene_type:complete